MKNTKEWLWRARNIDREIRSLLQTYEAERDRVTSITAKLGGDSVSGSKDPHKFDRLVELNDQINRRVDELTKIKGEILAALFLLDDYRYREVLKDYYVDMKTLEQIAVSMSYSYQHVKRLRAQAIATLKDELE